MSKDEAIKELTELLPEEFLLEYTDAIKMAIEALEQEPCDDAISRQAVIDAIEDDNRNGHYSCFATNNDAQCFKDVIRELPSVTPQSKMRWIPVSESLPEEDGQYLITVKYKHVNDSYEDVYAEHGEWHDGRWDMFCFGHCGEVEDIIAWMPLPEPYQSEIPTGQIVANGELYPGEFDDPLAEEGSDKE